MLKKLQNENFSFKSVCITGFSNIEISYIEIRDEIEKIQDKYKVIIQFFNSQLIASWEHLFFSVIHSLKAFDQGNNISNKLELEILLYASAQHQIKVAIERFGINEEIKNIAMIILGNSMEDIENSKLKISELIKGTENESVLNINGKKYESICKHFNITKLEIETASVSSKQDDKLDALKEIVLNRIAFVIFEK